MHAMSQAIMSHHQVVLHTATCELLVLQKKNVTYINL